MHPDFQHSIHAQSWDGITDRRKQPSDSYETQRAAHAPASGPNDPITREYLDKALGDWRNASREYFNGQFVRLEDLIRDGFPDGDPAEHRKVHENYIKTAKSRSEMWQAVLKQVLTGTVWAGLLAISTAVWVAIKTEVKK